MELDAAVLDALRPRGARERLRGLVARGYTALQVYERLDPAVREALEAGVDDPVLAGRRGVDRVHRALVGLVAAGRVRKRRETYGMQVNTKGGRGMVVDVYALA